MLGLPATSVIQITLSDSKTGLLNGNYPAELKVLDYTSNEAYWEANQTISFSNGFAEIIIGPIDNLASIKEPRVVVIIDDNRLEFPIHPSLFAVQSHRATQLSDTSALLVNNGKVGLGVDAPTTKLDILGDIQIRGTNSSIMFKNGPNLTASSLTQLLALPQQLTASMNQMNQSVNQLSTNMNQSIQTIESKLSNVQASINILEVQTGANPIQVTGSYNNQLLKINLDGSIAPLTSFYKNDSTNYLLRSNNGELFSTSISSDFEISNNDLRLNRLSQLRLLSESLPTNINNGDIRFNNNSFFVSFNNAWHELATKSNGPFISIESGTTNQGQPDTGNGGLLFDGTDYHLWKNAWVKLGSNDFSQLSPSNESTFVVIDQNGNASKRMISTNSSLTFDNQNIRINDQSLNDNTLVMWENNQLKSVTLKENGGIQVKNNQISLAAPFYTSANTKIGIGVEPTETLDVNGALRLRTLPLQSQSNVSAGSILFDGSMFKGWDGSQWHVFTQATSNGSTTGWQTNGSNLTASPNGNVGVKLNNPQATLDINGSLRIRDIPSASGSHPVLMVDSDGDILKGSLSFSDVLPSVSGATNGQLLGVSNNAWAPVDLQGSSTIAMDGFQAHLSTSNIRDNDVYMFKNNQWQAQQLTSSNRHITLTSTGLDLATSNVSNRSILYFDTDAWVTQPLINPNREVMIDSDGLRLSQMGAITGQQLTWDGASWVPSRNETVSYQAANGVQLINNTFQLASNLSWANNTFTIGSNSTASFVINRLSSTLTNPIQIKDANNAILTEINSAGQLSIGYNGGPEWVFYCK